MTPPLNSTPRTALLLVIGLAVLVRLAFSLGFTRQILHLHPEEEVSDGYHQIAENLYRDHGYRQYVDLPPTVQRPPAYPFFLALLFRLFGIHYPAVQVVQALLGGVGCWLLFLLGRWVLSERLGIAAAALFAVYPNAVEYSARLYAENLYYPLFFAFALALCRAWKESSPRWGFLAGGLWGLGLLTRGTLLAFPLAVALAIAISARHRRPAARWIRWTVPALLAGIMTLAPWTIRNYALTGSFVPVSTWGWAPFYHGIQCSKAMLAWTDLGQIDREAEVRRHQAIVDRLYGGDRTRAYASAREYVRHEAVARSLVLEELRSDPLGSAARAVVAIPFAWFQTYGQRMRLLSLLVHLPLMVLFVLGLLTMRRAYPEAFARAWPALGLIVFVNLFQAVVYPHVRYMSPAVALSFLYSGLPVVERIRSLWIRSGWGMPDFLSTSRNE